MIDPMYIETTLTSGARCRIWTTGTWAVIEANGLVTACPISRYGRYPLPASLLAEMAPALMEAAE